MKGMLDFLKDKQYNNIIGTAHMKSIYVYNTQGREG